jgi:hypothetical protein
MELNSIKINDYHAYYLELVSCVALLLAAAASAARIGAKYGCAMASCAVRRSWWSYLCIAGEKIERKCSHQ